MQLARTLVGMIHLLPLPGSARWAGSMQAVVEAAVADARALVDNGMDALLVENHGDVPFTTGRVEASAVAAMSVATLAIRSAARCASSLSRAFSLIMISISSSRLVSSTASASSCLYLM